MGVGVLGDAFLRYPPRLGQMLPGQVRWVQTYLDCVAPPALRVGSVRPIFGRFNCGSCGRYPYTLRLDWVLLLCCGFGG